MELFPENPSEAQVKKALEQIGPSRLKTIATWFNIEYERGKASRYARLSKVAARFPSEQAKPGSPRIYRARKSSPKEPYLSLNNVENKKKSLEERRREIEDELVEINVQVNLLDSIIEQILKK